MRKTKHCKNCGNEVYKTRAYGTWMHRLTQGPVCFTFDLWRGTRVEVDS